MATGPVTFAAGRTVLGKAQLSWESRLHYFNAGSGLNQGHGNVLRELEHHQEFGDSDPNQMAGFPAAADPGVGPLVARAIVSAIANGAAFHNGVEIPAEKCSSVLRSCLVLTTIPFVMD